MTAHTPGPWEREGTAVYALMDNPRPSRGMPTRINRFSAFVQGWDCPPEEREANARLIETAPELLTAAKDMLDLALKLAAEFVCDIDGDPEVIAARAVIAKAEGR